MEICHILQWFSNKIERKNKLTQLCSIYNQLHISIFSFKLVSLKPHDMMSSRLLILHNWKPDHFYKYHNGGRSVKFSWFDKIVKWRLQ